MKIIITTFFAISLCLMGCESAGKRTAIGAGVGAATGAAVGAVLGHQMGKRGEGAAIGAVLGGGIGAAYGHKLDKQAKELEKIAETRRTENGIITKLKGDILFKTGSPSVQTGARTNVQKISDILKKYPENRITIVGHTDSTGSDSTNQSLSEKRASSVKSIMVSRGVPAQNINVVGAGETSPVADNSTKDGRAQNRRVELQITMAETKEK